MTRLLLIGAAALALGATYSGSTQEWTGTAVGGVHQTRHFTANNGSATWNDISTYRGRFSFRFAVEANGAIKGSGSGTYSVIKWREQGTGSGGAFTCDAPKTAQPYKVTVSGHVSGRQMILELHAPKATEVLAADLECGAQHKLFAGTTTYLRDSLAAVVGKGVRVRAKSGVVLHLTKHADFMQASPNSVPPGKNHVIQEHTWTIALHG